MKRYSFITIMAISFMVLFAGVAGASPVAYRFVSEMNGERRRRVVRYEESARPSDNSPIQLNEMVGERLLHLLNRSLLSFGNANYAPVPLVDETGRNIKASLIIGIDGPIGSDRGRYVECPFDFAASEENNPNEGGGHHRGIDAFAFEGEGRFLYDSTRGLIMAGSANFQKRTFADTWLIGKNSDDASAGMSVAFTIIP